MHFSCSVSQDEIPDSADENEKCYKPPRKSPEYSLVLISPVSPNISLSATISLTYIFIWNNNLLICRLDNPNLFFKSFNAFNIFRFDKKCAKGEHKLPALDPFSEFFTWKIIFSWSQRWSEFFVWVECVGKWLVPNSPANQKPASISLSSDMRHHTQSLSLLWTCLNFSFSASFND